MNPDPERSSAHFADKATGNFTSYGTVTPEATFIRGVGYAILALAATIQETFGSSTGSPPASASDPTPSQRPVERRRPPEDDLG